MYGDGPYARTIRAHPSNNIEDARAVIAAAEVAAEQLEPLDRDTVAGWCWAWLRENVVYVEELGDQFIRMPWRTAEDGIADCKSYAVFIAAWCLASGCDVSLRFVVQGREDYYSHVYPIVDGIPVDACLEFGEEVSYIVAETIPLTNG